METKTKMAFLGTAEQEAELLAAIDEMKDLPGALMPVMQKAQEIYGYLPIEVQSIISDAMDVPIEKIYGIATFYAQFALAPKGTDDRNFSLSSCRCVGACGLAPVMLVDGDVYSRMTPGQVADVLAKYA